MKLECRRGVSSTPLDMRGIFSSFFPLGAPVLVGTSTGGKDKLVGGKKSCG